jgi:hypothetical protein
MACAFSLLTGKEVNELTNVNSVKKYPGEELRQRPGTHIALSSTSRTHESLVNMSARTTRATAWKGKLRDDNIILSNLLDGIDGFCAVRHGYSW